MSTPSAGELAVTWEDQKRINSFSVIVNKSERLMMELEKLTRDIEASKDALRELEMVLDEDEPIGYRCGGGFCQIPYDKASHLIQTGQQSEQRRAADLRAKLADAEERSAILKKVLQAKFGDAIQLEM